VEVEVELVDEVLEDEVLVLEPPAAGATTASCELQDAAPTATDAMARNEKRAQVRIEIPRNQGREALRVDDEGSTGCAPRSLP
jgi:hypothetical protein